MTAFVMIEASPEARFGCADPTAHAAILLHGSGPRAGALHTTRMRQTPSSDVALYAHVYPAHHRQSERGPRTSRWARSSPTRRAVGDRGQRWAARAGPTMTRPPGCGVRRRGGGGYRRGGALAAYAQLREMLTWLLLPLTGPSFTTQLRGHRRRSPVQQRAWVALRSGRRRSTANSATRRSNASDLPR